MSQGCWTCRDRKVRCDLRLPTCSNCARADRQCLGYGFRLAWPRKGDKRRAIVYEPGSINEKTKEDRAPNKRFFVNVSSDEVGTFFDWSHSWSKDEANMRRVSASITQDIAEQRALAHRYIESLPPSQPVTWSIFDEKGRPPLNYYIQRGPRMFASHQGDVLAPLLLKIAVFDTSLSSTAVLHAILGLSSSYMGRHEEALAYRASAVSKLSSSLGPDAGQRIAFQRIATSMLLCMFEIYYVSHTSRNWALYLCGIKNIILDALTNQKIQDEECIALRDWMHFYEVLARFSVAHWVGEPFRLPICYGEPKSNLIQVARNGSSLDTSSTIGYSREIFDCICDACDLIISPQPIKSTPNERQKQVRELELKLRLVKSDTAGNRVQRTTDQLYLLGALIYLNKIGLGYSGEELYHRQLVDDALQLLTNVESRDVPWPFFIVGCEARTDHHRRKVLELAFARRRRGESKRIPSLLPLIERFWSQDDLDTEQALSYVDKMSTVVSASPFLPAFA